MNQPKCLQDIIKNSLDRYSNSCLKFDGFLTKNGTISYIELKFHLENVKLLYLNIFKQI